MKDAEEFEKSSTIRILKTGEESWKQNTNIVKTKMSADKYPLHPW